jgi:hypothetical protein
MRLIKGMQNAQIVLTYRYLHKVVKNFNSILSVFKEQLKTAWCYIKKDQQDKESRKHYTYMVN